MSVLPLSSEKGQLHDVDMVPRPEINTVASNANEITIENVLDPQERIIAERALVRKLDMRLLPAIVLIYVMNYIDRAAITSAKLKGVAKDLRLSDLHYDVVVAILYATFCPTQVIANMVLNKVSRPSLFIGACVLVWGFISALTGVVHSYRGMLACRLFIGIPEAIWPPDSLNWLFSGTIYLLSKWYTRKQLAFRSAILYCGLLMSNAFGNLMAAGVLSGMEGVRGIRAWRWLFYIEGTITIFVGFFTIWALPDYPHNTRWLNPAETRLAQARLAEEVGESDRDGTGDSALSGLKMAVSDIKVHLFMILAFSQLLGLSFLNFFPTLTHTLGFSTTMTLLLAAPPWVLSSILCSTNALHADRTGERFFHIYGCIWPVMVGYIISLSTMSVGGRYVSLFLMAMGYAGFSLLPVWVSNAIPRPPAKRAAAIGLVIGFGNTGILIGSFIWKAAWGPRYRQSMIISLTALAFSSFVAVAIRQMLIHENHKMDIRDVAELKGAKRERVQEYARLEGITFEEAIERNKGFRYLY